MTKKNYRVGIDVGEHSCAFSAIEIDLQSDCPTLREILDAKPMKILNSATFIHDASVYDHKTAVTRKERAGVVRRAKRRLKTKRKRLKQLDILLEENGFPVQFAKELSANMPKGESPLFQWEARSRAAQSYIENEQERMLAVAISVMHIARHRGWRNAYSRFESLEQDSKSPSDFYRQLMTKICEWLEEHNAQIPYSFTTLDENRPTPAQMVSELQKYRSDIKVRGYNEDASSENNVTMGKLHQSDYYDELHRILKMQDVDPHLSNKILEAVFQQVNPRDVAAAANLVGKDALQPGHPRASRSSIAFQEFRILTTIANLRISKQGSVCPLDVEEKKRVFALLTSTDAAKKGIDWSDVAEELDISRGELEGVGKETEEGDPISAKYPPILSIDDSLKKLFKASSSLSEWWGKATSIQKELFLSSIDNAGIPSYLNDKYPEELDEIASLIESFDETALKELDSIELSSGRSSYGIDTLQRLNKRMLEGLDLHEARKAEFHVGDDWKPAPSPLGTPVGNGAADIVIKLAARWLLACEEKWGTPLTVSIEHVRAGFKSEKSARKIQREQNNRFKKNRETRAEISKSILPYIKESLDASDSIRRSNRSEASMSDIRKQQALERQNNQCLYCGKGIAFNNAQVDHIVPRKRIGSSNSLYNIVAVCEDCNISKGVKLYSAWASPKDQKETIDRVRHLTRSAYFSEKEFKHYKKELITRLKQTEEDEDLDSRSFESIAWMAKELRSQIEGHLNSKGEMSTIESATSMETEDSKESPNMERALRQRVFVYRGWITSNARKVGGIEKALPWIGGSNKKDRLDRRHHAVDAAVIAMMNPGVAQLMAIQNELRRGDFDKTGSSRDFNEENQKQLDIYKHSNRFSIWKDVQMKELKELLKEQMIEKRIPVMHLKRLKLDNNDAHKETIYKAAKRKLGDSISAVAVNKVSSKEIWEALTGLNDYDPQKGLQDDQHRSIKVNGKILTAEDEIVFLAPEENKRGNEGMSQKLDKEDGIAYKLVRGGVVELGSSIHHSRIYKLPPKKEGSAPTYCQMRVYQADLLGVKTDLFEYDIPEFSYSRRFADPKLRQALLEETAEYIGWLVINDEIQVDPKKFSKNIIGDFFSIPDFSDISQFVVSGFESNAQLKLRPAGLSYEGLKAFLEKHSELTDSQIKAARTILKDKGWRVTVNDLMRSGVKILRRNTLGFVRWRSNNHMPISWQSDM